MQQRFNQSLDTISEFLAHRKGLLPLLGIALIIVNAVLNIFAASSWLAQTDLLLHIGLVAAILGFSFTLAL